MNGAVVYFNSPKFMLVSFYGIALTLLLGGCAILGGPADLERASGYELKVPESWKALKRGESDKAFQLSSGNIVSIVSSCHRNADAPLEVLTRHLLIGTRHVKILSRQKRRFGSNEGLYSKVLARLDSKNFNLELFVLTKNECVFDFSLISPNEIPEEDSGQFVEFLGSFHYGKD